MKHLGPFLFCGFLLGLTACSSAPKKIQPPAEVLPPGSEKISRAWTARLQVEELRAEKKNRVDLEVAAVKPSTLRLDAKGTFGILGGIGLLKGDQATFILARQKKAYIGRAGPASLVPFLNIDLDPRVLLPVFFDEPIDGWSCREKTQQLDHCEHEGYVVAVTERDAQKRKVEITGPDFRAILVIKDDGTKVMDDAGAFNVAVPDGYRIYKLP